MLHVGPYSVHIHPLLETLGYFLGFRLYVRLRRRHGDVVVDLQRLWVLAAATVGGAVGSKVLSWFENPGYTFSHWTDVSVLFAGKTVVGGFLGGLAAVEITKAFQGVKTHTGDLFALPLILGTAVGRIGCFFSGLEDHTYGLPTALPWGVDFGDGIPRHPTQLYEVVFLALLAAAVLYAGRRMRQGALLEGDPFKVFMIGYLGWRLAVDFLKPDIRLVLGLSGIQLACVAGLIYYLPHILRMCGWKGAQLPWRTP
ncbi:MAG TPA: prolipoprotein diacylglyceryl transferase family protein [Candidatus Sulfotelmatobacter sp.]|nr:prolipoprotein diacylglyceryl transferase family protein [Candidatus Sulfotelmatobacter sp.]